MLLRLQNQEGTENRKPTVKVGFLRGENSSKGLCAEGHETFSSARSLGDYDQICQEKKQLETNMAKHFIFI